MGMFDVLVVVAMGCVCGLYACAMGEKAMKGGDTRKLTPFEALMLSVLFWSVFGGVVTVTAFVVNIIVESGK